MCVCVLVKVGQRGRGEGVVGWVRYLEILGKSGETIKTTDAFTSSPQD